jgi:hypothetical protein
MHLVYRSLVLVCLSFIVLPALAADDKNDKSVQGMPEKIGMFKGPLAQFMEIKSVRHIPNEEITWSGTVYVELKKFKGMKAVLSEGGEDDHPVGEVKLKFVPEKEDYQKGDKLSATLKFPNAKAYKECGKIKLVRLQDNKK